MIEPLNCTAVGSGLQSCYLAVPSHADVLPLSKPSLKISSMARMQANHPPRGTTA